MCHQLRSGWCCCQQLMLLTRSYIVLHCCTSNRCRARAIQITTAVAVVLGSPRCHRLTCDWGSLADPVASFQLAEVDRRRRHIQGMDWGISQSRMAYGGLYPRVWQSRAGHVRFIYTTPRPLAVLASTGSRPSSRTLGVALWRPPWNALGLQRACQALPRATI
jgi:hypothetical protein